MVDERYILKKSGVTHSIETEYNIDGIWTVVHSELSGDISYLQECEFVDSKSEEGYYEAIYKPKKANNGIWIKSKKQGSHFNSIPIADIDFTSEYSDAIYENLAETRFLITDENGEIIGCPELTESLNKMDEEMMYFNFNWLNEKLNPTPLKKILELMNKEITAEIIFHDVENIIMYKILLTGFKFKKIYNLRRYNWDNHGIKELAVSYSFTNEKIIIN